MNTCEMRVELEAEYTKEHIGGLNSSEVEELYEYMLTIRAKSLHIE